MKGSVFEAGLILGIVLVGIGVGLEFGLGYGLASAGLLVLGFVTYISRVAGVKAAKREGGA